MLEQVTNRPVLDELLAAPGASIYIGFDPTADSLHVGHLLPALMLSRFQRAGHRPIVVVGVATGMIGDPSGRASERQLLTPEIVEANSRTVRTQLSRFVSFEGDNAALMTNNADWIAPISHLEWLRDVGKHFTVNYMIAKESVRRRLEDREHGISYTEFSYMLLQAYDFLHLRDHHGCRIQAGGSDQWGNITAGAELIRRVRGEEVFGITFPLLATSSGEKFGKSAGNAVWLDAERTSPYQFYQYWIRTDDRDVERFLKLFTFLSLDEIESVCAAHRSAPERRVAQKKLAEEVTRIVHGADALEQAVKASEALFSGASKTNTPAIENMPSFEVQSAELDRGIKIVELMVRSGATKSRGEAARLIEGGGVYLNEKRVEGPASVLNPADVGATFLLRVGKKSYFQGRIGP